MSKVTILTKPNRIVIASKGVQGAPGKDGVITPELEGLRDEAQQAAQDAAGSATIASDAAGAAVTAQGAAEGSAGQASASAALAEQARLLGATIGFATKADMDASLAHPAGTLALVTNDPTPANNGTYRKTGASGSGSWVKSADRVTGLEGRVGAAELQAGATGMFYPNPSAINLDLNAGLLKITASQVRVFYGRSSFLLAGQEVAIPSTRQRLIANVTTGEVSFTTAATTPSTHVVLGSYDQQERKLVGFPPHFVNGVLSVTPSFATALAANGASNITFDSENKRFQITGGAVRLVSPEITQILPATDIPWPSSGIYRIEYDRAANSVGFYVMSAAVDKSRIVFGYARFNPAGVTVFGIPEYRITGDLQQYPVFEGVLTGQAQYIDFDFGAGVLRITADNQIRAQYGRLVPYVPAQEVALPSGASGQWHKLLYDVDTGALSFLAGSSAFQPGNTIIVGMVRVSSRQVAGLLDYYVNGQPSSSSGGSALADREWIAVNGPTEPSFVVAPPLPDFKWANASPNHATVYAMYDALVTSYPEYVSRTLLGPDDAGNSIYRYDFAPPAVPSGAPRPAKMILMAGFHGGERAGTIALGLALQQICDKWQTEPLLETLRWNCHFIVIPVASPWGFDNGGRKNENGVDLARNFPTMWESGSDNPASEQYRGPFPLSEKPVQYIDAIMAANRDAIYCGSFHNFGDPGPNNYFIWNASGTKFGQRLAQSLISKLSRAWKTRYSWMPQDHTSYLGYSDMTTPPGSEGRHATAAYDIQGGTFEICASLPLAPDSGIYSSEVATLGAETIVNWLLVNLEHGAKLYNGRGG